MAVRIGFIGCGGIARHHMRMLAGIEGAELAAYYDVDEGKAKECANQFGGQAFGSLEEMLDKAGLDAVYICTPPFAHGDIEKAVMAHGLPFFVEKPVALSVSVAEEIAEELERRGLFASVGYHFRYYDTVEKAKELLSEKEVGMVLGWWLGGFVGAPWWRVYAKSGGQIVEQTTHIFDLARYLVGEVEEVHAYMALRLLKDIPEMDVPDVGVCNLKFENGVVGNISNTCITRAGGRIGLAVYCKDFVIDISGGRLTVMEPEKSESFDPKVDPYELEDRIFVEAVRTNDPSAIRSPYADALRTLKVTLAANESAREGRPVKVSV